MKIKRKEWDKINNALSKAEHQLYHELGLSRISGGWVAVDFDGFDNDWVYVKIKDGVSSDCEKWSNEWDGKLDRTTLKLI